MSQSVEFVLDGKEAGAVRAWLAVQRAQEAAAASLGKIDVAQEKNAKSAADWDRIAQKTLRDLETPQQRHNNRLKELSELLSRGKLNFEQFTGAAKQSHDQLAKATGAATDGAEAAGLFSGKILGVGTAIGGVAAIASRLKAEYDDLLQRQGKAGETQISLAAAQRMATFNLGNDQSLTPAKMAEELAAIAGRTGVGQEQATKVFSDMLSARGDMKAVDVLPRLEAVLNAAPDQGGLPVLGGATMSLGTEFGLSGKESLGFMLQAQAASPVVSLESLAMHSVPSMVSVSKFGDTPEQAAELVSGLASAGKDSRGAESGTASIQLAARLAQVLPSLGSTAERIEAVRNSKSLQSRVFSKEFGEAQYKPIFKELLTGGEDSKSVQAYRGAQTAITSPQEAAPVLERLLQQYESLPLAGTAAAGRVLGSGADQARAKDIFGGQSAVIRKGLNDVLEANNVSKSIRDLLGSKFDMATQLGSGNPIEEAIGILESQSRYLGGSRPQAMSGGVAPSMGGAIVPQPVRAPTAEERRQATAMEEVAKSLRELKASLDKNNVEVAKNNQQLDNANRGESVKPNTTPASPVPSATNSTPSVRP